MDWSFRDYVEFVSGVTMFRTLRDLDQFPETWLERKVTSIKVGNWTGDEQQELLLIAKFAELADDRKTWLLEEIEEDLYKIWHPGCRHAQFELPDPGLGWDWWSELDIEDDEGNKLGVGMNTEKGIVHLSGNIKADDQETADRILTERIEAFLQELPLAA